MPIDDAQAMGYKLAILPVLLFNAVVGVCDQMLDELKQARRHPIANGGRRAEGVFPANGRGRLGFIGADRSAGAAGLIRMRQDLARDR